MLDEDSDLYTRVNKEMVFTEEVTNKYDVLELKEMIKAVSYTHLGKKTWRKWYERTEATPV